MIPDQHHYISFSNPIGTWMEPIKGYGAYHYIENSSNSHLDPIDYDWKVPIMNFDSKWLIVFDLDSTLIPLESIDEMIKFANPSHYDSIRMITERAMNGELDFKESLECRVGLLKGKSASCTFQNCLERLSYKEGVVEFLSHLHNLCNEKKCNLEFAIISGGFMNIANKVGRDLGIPHVYAHELEIESDEFTGKLSFGTNQSSVIDGNEKRRIMFALANELSCKYTMAIGDGANDIQMLSSATIGIAIKGKKNVERAGKLSIDNMATLCHLFA